MTSRPSVTQRVLHVSTVHGPHDTRIFFKEARALAASGFDVTIAGTVERAAWRDGVNFIPLGSRDGPRFRRIVRDFRALTAILKNLDAIVHIHDPELLVIAALPAFAGARVVYDVHEVYMDRIPDRAWIPSSLRHPVARLYDWIERVTLPRFAGIVVAFEDLTPRYTCFLPADRIALVRNFPNITPSEVEAARAKPHPLGDDAPYVLHTGGSTKQVAFHTLVAAAERLRERGSKLRIVNVGEICLDEYAPAEARELRERAHRAGVVMTGRLDLTEVYAWNAHARIGCVSFTDTENHRKTMPNKLFEYACFGLPVVASDVGHVGRIVREHGLGFAVPIGDGVAHADAMAAIHDDETLHASFSDASAKMSDTYSFAGELDRLRDLYARIGRSPRASRGAPKAR